MIGRYADGNVPAENISSLFSSMAPDDTWSERRNRYSDAGNSPKAQLAIQFEDRLRILQLQKCFPDFKG